MSELKSHRIDNIISAYKIGKAFCMKTEEEVYLKSEADKVIEEKDKKIDLYKRGWEENDKVNAYLYAATRHHKYKRCLAMANFCFTKSLFLRYVLADRIQNGENYISANNWRINLYEKWCDRWKKLAEKFKEAK